MAKSDELSRRLLNYIFCTSAPTTSGSISVTSTSTNLWVSLHTALPSNGGLQSDGEIVYGSYHRIATSRTAVGEDGWTISGPPYQVFPNSTIQFPSYYGDPQTLVGWAVGTSSSTATDTNAALLYIGSLTPIDTRELGMGLTADSDVSES